MKGGIIMFIIWGTKTLEKNMGVVSTPHTCPHCQAVMYPQLERLTKFFSLFFIPIIPLTSHYYLTCSNCRHVAEVTREIAKALPVAV